MKFTKYFTFVLLASFCLANANTLDRVLARATKFHKNDPNCDPWTARGETCTQIRLRENHGDIIGMVAVDPSEIPYGSLIYCPQNGRFYLACNRGGAVSARTAAKRLARIQGRSKKYHDAIVLDFYAPREIIDNHFDYFFVIEHEGPSFRFDLSKSEQELRLNPDFWLERANETLRKDDRFKNELHKIIDRLQEMSRKRTRRT